MEIKKIIAIGIIFLFIGIVVIPSTAQNIEKSSSASRGHWLYVGGSGPGNYTKIQDAIDASSDGDTVFVYEGIYYEDVLVNKSITLLGEDKDTTFIWNPIAENGCTVTITANLVNISGFGIFNSSCSREGIRMENSKSSTIVDCDIFLNYGGILIENSENITVVRCHLMKNDMWFYNVSDSQIINCSVQNTSGIYVEESSNNTIENCSISDSGYGIWLDFSSTNHTIKNCDIFNNSDFGIRLSYKCNFTVVENCHITNCYDGFDIFSDQNTITDNVLVNNGFHIYKSEKNIFIGNTVNGKPLRYLEDESDQFIEDAGQVILINCSNITVQNLNISNATVGITLSSTYHCQIKNNSISNNYLAGILSDTAYNNVIVKNMILSTRFWAGIQLSNEFNSTINANIINNNENENTHAAGITITISGNTNIISNNIVRNAWLGISIGSDHSSITGNTVTNNRYSGMYSGGDDNILSANTIVDNNGVGILSSLSENNIIINNTITNNSEDGISLEDCTYYTILNNTIANNGENGINFEDHGYFNTLVHNVITHNNLSGVSLLHYSGFNTIFNNTITNNNYCGILLGYDNENNMSKNIITNNNFGIFLSTGSNDDNVTKNTITFNSKGVFLSHADNNIITGNNISKNEQGVYIMYSTKNMVVRNNFIENKQQAFFYQSKNSWNQNYWNRPHIFPKLIFGRIGRLSLIPWINVDWHPALLPNDIPEVG